MRSTALLPGVVVFCLAGCAGPIAPSGVPEASSASSTVAASEVTAGAVSQPTADQICHAPWIPMDVSPLCNPGYDLQFRSDGRCQRCVKASSSPKR
jgi:hypothetical protein